MAINTLGNTPVGSIVKLNENGVPAEFYVAKHDYESNLNGEGRTLLVRKDCYDARKWWASGQGDNEYATSSIDSWLNGTYKAKLDKDVQNAIGSTTFYYTPHKEVGKTPKVTTLTRSVFLLSVRELGLYDSASGNANKEGTELPIADTLQIAYYQGSAVNQWTRSPYVGNTSSVFIVSERGDPQIQGDSALGLFCSRPAFTLSGSLYVFDDGTLTTNVPPEITGSIASGSTLGIKNDAVSFSYSISDIEGDAVTAKEYIDGNLLNSRDVVLGQNYSVEISGAEFQKVLNGEHVISVVANDGIADSEPYEIYFTKKVTSASMTLRYALEADDQIQVAAMALVGSIPADAEVNVMLTNNANDEAPVWEDATAAVIAGENYVFTNQTAVNGFAFNFMVSVSRGESDTGGYITSIGGAFQ